MGLSSRFAITICSPPGGVKHPAIRFACRFVWARLLRSHLQAYSFTITASAGAGSVGGTASQKTFYLSDLSELERRRMKQFRSGELAIHQALFVKVLCQRLDFRLVFRHAISPEITPHQRAGLVGFSFKPWQT